MAEVFGLGDTVRLRSGGPVMTVNEKAQGGGLVCVWFAGDDVKHHAFRAEALEPVPCTDTAEGPAAAAKA